jgi:hypothetical protein
MHCVPPARAGGLPLCLASNEGLGVTCSDPAIELIWRLWCTHVVWVRHDLQTSFRYHSLEGLLDPLSEFSIGI